jgi:hypothetical protein
VQRAAAQAGAWKLPALGFYFQRYMLEMVIETLLAGGLRLKAAEMTRQLEPVPDDDDAFWQLIQARLALDEEPRRAAGLASLAGRSLAAAGYPADECRARRLAAEGLRRIGQIDEAARSCTANLWWLSRPG